MVRQRYLRWILVLMLSLTACQQPFTPTQPTATSQPQEIFDKQGIQWNVGSHASAVLGGADYSFSSGVHIQTDGSITLSRLNTAEQTRHSDLNGDGFKDIVIANSGNYEFVESPFAQIRKQNEDHDMPDAQIYWGASDGYNEQRTTGIPGDRPSSLAALDFNLDGILDLAVAGGGEFHPPYVNSRVYWGTSTGYSDQNYVSLPTNAATGTAAGDLNKDGYPDVLFANLGDYNFPFPPSLIYWGGPEGFQPNNRMELETHGVGGIAIADVNQDTWLDVVVGNSAGFPPMEHLMDYGQDYDWPKSYIYLGGPEGFSSTRRIELPTKGATGVKVADLNKDQYQDIVFTNAGSFALPPLPDSYIYWGGKDGYSPANRTDLATNGGSGVSIADLNKDTWLDLVISVTGTYLYIGKPEFPNSFVYWGDPDGFSDTRRLALPTEASQGNTITDVNNDGVLDILFSQLGDFNPPYRPVLIYYGTGQTDAFYSAKNTGTLPGQISYGSIVVGPSDGGDYMSHGSVAVPQYDNPDHYVQGGQLIASVSREQLVGNTAKLTYGATIPAGTTATVILESTLDGATWQELGQLVLATGEHSADIPLSQPLVDASQLRYRLLLATETGTATPHVAFVQFKNN